MAVKVHTSHVLSQNTKRAAGRQESVYRSTYVYYIIFLLREGGLFLGDSGVCGSWKFAVSHMVSAPIYIISGN